MAGLLFAETVVQVVFLDAIFGTKGLSNALLQEYLWRLSTNHKEISWKKQFLPFSAAFSTARAGVGFFQWRMAADAPAVFRFALPAISQAACITAVSALKG
ncbi:hypothetical protein A7P98_02010 [Eikenella sp. NML080894]|nr:hypothetical protein A7P98_02010 [Eikenella sp. NML080894]